MDVRTDLMRYAPGLYEHDDPRPLVRAKELADELAARLCTTAEEADLAVEELAALPPLSADDLDVLQALAERVTTAQRILDNTLDRAAEEVGDRLATGAGMAVHPSAFRERAAAVVAARAAAAAAEARVLEADAEAEAVAEAEAAAAAEEAPFEVSASGEVSAPERTGWRRFFRRRRREPEQEDTSESTSLLQQMAATTDEAFGARRAAAARDDQVLLAAARRDRALEDVRVAERAWQDLAGDEPVEDVEAVVRRLDPQHEDARLVAQDTVGVRASGVLLARALEEWTAGWGSLGHDEPSVEPGAMEAVAARATQTIVLVGSAVGCAEAIARVAPAAPVLTVEPTAAS